MTYPKPTTKYKQYFLAGASGLVVSLLMFAMSTDHLNRNAVCYLDDDIMTLDNLTVADCERTVSYLLYAITSMSIFGGSCVAYVTARKRGSAYSGLTSYLLFAMLLAFASPMAYSILMIPVVDSLVMSFELCHPDPPEDEFGLVNSCLHIPSSITPVLQMVPILCAFAVSFFHALVFKRYV